MKRRNKLREMLWAVIGGSVPKVVQCSYSGCLLPNLRHAAVFKTRADARRFLEQRSGRGFLTVVRVYVEECGK